ncbi:hypothetical protein [Aurantibacter sp.]|uniref:hypothetical protein n=1 Tax=Aurantibacter sp. TaxID=2807103 RepID=UPI0035C7C1BC
METLELLKSDIKNAKQNINLIDGCFSSSEASDIINALLKVKINFHKLHRLSITEGNSKDKCEVDNSRINELINEEAFAKAFFTQARLQGKKLKMTSTINITVED